MKDTSVGADAEVVGQENPSPTRPFKRYQMPSGEIVELSKEEFENLVACFKLLHEQSLKSEK